MIRFLVPSLAYASPLRYPQNTQRNPMHYFTPAKTLPEGTIYLTDLTHVADFAD